MRKEIEIKEEEKPFFAGYLRGYLNALKDMKVIKSREIERINIEISVKEKEIRSLSNVNFYEKEQYFQ